MNQEFGDYLVYILLMSLILSIGFIYMVLKRKKEVPPKAVKIAPGCVSVFFDPNNHIVVIPYAKDKYGVGRAICEPIFLQFPYTKEKLGNAVRNGMKISVLNQTGTDKGLMEKLGTQSWKEFSKDKRNVSIHFKEGYGILFNSTRRKADGAYDFTTHPYDGSLPIETNDEDLGKTLLRLSTRCK